MDSNQILSIDKDLGWTQIVPHESKMVTAAILKNQKKCHISSTVWPILIKFAVVMHMKPLHLTAGSKHITMPNFLETGLSKADILRFFQIFKIAAEIAKFYWLFGVEKVETHQHAKFR